MSDDTPNGIAKAPNGEIGIDDDLDNTHSQGISPNETTAGGWQMPAPVFRQTSGYLPEGFEKQFGIAEQAQPVGEAIAEATTEASIEVTAPEIEAIEPTEPVEPEAKVSPPSVSAIDIEPQPDVIAELELDEEMPVSSAPPVKKKSTVGRIILTILALIVIAALTLVFAVVVWYLLTPLPESIID